MYPMPSALTLELLAWVDGSDRSYGEAMEAWRSTCPRHPVWDDAVLEGLIRVDSASARPMRERRVVLTARGQAALAAHPGGVRPVAEREPTG
jgi:hypothetical protein